MDTENSSDTEPVPLSPIKITANNAETETENETVCWSPRFEFDAPRYTNFSSKKYRETGKLLKKLVLNQENDEDEEGDNSGPESKSDVNNQGDSDDYEMKNLDSSSDSSDLDTWFDRFHPLHEPLRPMTPPGPLISPERSFNAFKLVQSLKASPLKLDSSPKGELLNTPSKGPNTRIGLRSKPARVLKNSSIDNRQHSNGNSINSSPSSLIRTNFSNINNQNSPRSPIRNNTQSSPIKSNQFSPIRNNNQFSPVRKPHSTQSAQNSPVRTFTSAAALMTPTRLSINSTASSITLSVSSLTKTFYNTDTLDASNPLVADASPKISTSPLKMKTKFSEGSASPLRKAVGILQIEEPDPIKNPKKRPTEELTTATAASTNTNTNASAISEVKKLRSMNAELEDIKKLLSQHNNRIRPHNSNNKRTK